MKRILFTLFFTQVVIFSVHAQWSGGTTDAVNIHRSGNVAIGTSSTSSFKLFVNGPGFFTDNITLSNNNPTTQLQITNSSLIPSRAISLSNFGNSSSAIYWTGLPSANTGSLNYNGSLIIRSTNGLIFSGSSTAEHMRISDNGNVGIGTSTPAASLDVVNKGGETVIFRPNTLGNQLSHIHHGSTGNWYIRSASTAGKVILQDAGGNVGIGEVNPTQKLHIKGRVILDPLSGEQPTIYTGTGTSELGRYLILLNSPNSQSASGLKTGGLLVSDTYAFAHPLKNDMVVKGNIGIGTGTVSTYSKMTLQNASGSFLNLISTNGTSEILLGADQNGGIISTMSNHDLILRAGGNINRMVVKASGNIGIGTNDPGLDKLAVNGNIKAHQVKVSIEGWSDFVFDEDYKLRSLLEVEDFIKENKHLPEIPSAKEVEKNGVNLGSMDALLLQKIEELTLYMIEQNKKIETLEKRIEDLQK